MKKTNLLVNFKLINLAIHLSSFEVESVAESSKGKGIRIQVLEAQKADPFTCAGRRLRPVYEEGVHIVQLEVMQRGLQVRTDMLRPQVTQSEVKQCEVIQN